MLQIVGCAIPRVLRCASSSNEAQKVSVRLAMQGLLGLAQTTTFLHPSERLQSVVMIIALTSPSCNKAFKR